MTLNLTTFGITALGIITLNADWCYAECRYEESCVAIDWGNSLECLQPFFNFT